MTVFFRSDVTSHQGPCGINHTKKAGERYLTLECTPDCEAAARKLTGLWAEKAATVPMTDEEQALKEEQERDVTLAMAAYGSELRQTATAKATQLRQAQQADQGRRGRQARRSA